MGVRWGLGRLGTLLPGFPSLPISLCASASLMETPRGKGSRGSGGVEAEDKNRGTATNPYSSTAKVLRSQSPY